MLQPLLTPLVAVAAGSLALVGCAPLASGSVTSEEREIDQTVTAIDLDGVGHVNLRTGDEASLRVTAGENILDEIQTEVRDGVLHLDVRRGFSIVHDTITYDVVLPEIRGITVSGAGDVDAALASTDALAVILDGAGRVQANGVDVADLRVEVNGAGEVEIDGHADRQSVVIDGVGSYDGAALECADAEVVVSGAGKADVEATGSLDARVEGVGSITHGGGAHVTEHVEGAGSIHER